MRCKLFCIGALNTLSEISCIVMLPWKVFVSEFTEGRLSVNIFLAKLAIVLLFLYQKSMSYLFEDH